ncbi:S8 family serine peptidase [bacterium]|nr:S8 family serine peptidase [bacterium]
MKKTFLLLLPLISIAVLADPGPIRLRETVIDPESAAVSAVSEPQCAPTSSGRFQYILQPAKNFDDDEIKVVESLGVEIVGYFPPNAYHILASKEELDDLKAQFEILYAGEYVPAFKTTGAFAQTMSGKDSSFTALIILTSGSAYGEVEKFLKENGSSKCELISETAALVRAEITSDLVPMLSNLSTVVNVEEEPVFTIDNDVARTSALMNVAAVNSVGYTGKGVTVCVADTGFDSGDPNTIHPDFKGKKITGVVCSYNTSRTEWSDLNGHGTHCAGSVLGNGAVGEGVIGMAPDADIYFICCGGSGNGIAAPDESDVKLAYQAGARIMSNSYGAGADGEYNTSARTWDQICKKYPDYLVLFSAGNNNKDIITEDNCTIGSAAISKNIITVGASENYRPDVATTYSIFGAQPGSIFYDDKIAYPANGVQQGMMMNSSRGPAKDGRIKPDVCAPGTQVKSTESLYDSKNNGTRLSYYTHMSGTSMSTPLAAGACADIRQYLMENGYESPSSALVRAVLINGCRSMGFGQYSNNSEIPNKTPNCVNGFGHVNLFESIRPSSGQLFTFEGSLKNTGDEVSFTFANTTTNTLNVSLCWTDLAGSVGAAVSLINDLDLVVTDGENTYLPNSLRSGTDTLNNTEKVHVEAVPPGDNIEVTVKAGNLMRPNQAFALAISGVDELVPEPSLAFAALLIALVLGRKTK